jgi:hypothetical protein
MVQCQHTVRGAPTELMPYHSCVGAAVRVLSQHVQRLLGDMINVKLTSGIDCVIEVDIIIAMDGYLLFGVDYHSWLIATKDKHIIMAGGGPDDGSQEQMTTYGSEPGGIAAGLGILGTLARSGLKLVHAVILICNNSVAVLSSKRDLTPSVFHCTESNLDLIATIKYIEKEWCPDIEIRYSWAKGHVDSLNSPLTRNELMNVEADTVTYQIWLESCRSHGARPQYTHWGEECASLSIEGVKCTRHNKQKLCS